MFQIEFGKQLKDPDKSKSNRLKNVFINNNAKLDVFEKQKLDTTSWSLLHNNLYSVEETPQSSQPFQPFRHFLRRPSTLHCKNCHKLHSVQECDIFLCPHCFLYHTPYGNCQQFNREVYKRDKLRSKIFRLQQKAQQNNINPLVCSSDPNRFRSLSQRHRNKPPDSNWRRASNQTIQIKEGFNKRHWQKHAFKSSLKPVPASSSPLYTYTSKFNKSSHAAELLHKSKRACD